MKKIKLRKQVKKVNVRCSKQGKMEPCCVACGNPAYPLCKISCKIFDD